MSTATMSLDALVEFLRSLDDRTKKYVFEHVFIISDTSPLSPAESRDLEMGLKEYRKGKTVEWHAGE
ncbi:hypothetical protein DRQ36_10170 [bacterium]|nr:MAG: hypothetical protein DRQ36_10170 [bacterium]